MDILENKELIRIWLEQGLTWKQIAKNLGVSDRTLRNQRKKNAEIFSALENATVETNKNNMKVEYALLKNALGYDYYEEIPNKIKYQELASDGKTLLNCERIEVVKVKKHVKGDTMAQKFWLNNRKESYWKDNPHKVKNDTELMELRKKELESKIINL